VLIDHSLLHEEHDWHALHFSNKVWKSVENVIVVTSTLYVTANASQVVIPLILLAVYWLSLSLVMLGTRRDTQVSVTQPPDPA